MVRASWLLTIILVTVGWQPCAVHAQAPQGAPERPYRPNWAGVYPTVLTPWRPGGGVDHQALAAQIEYQLKGGVHGLLLLGTIGEGQYASMKERADVIRGAAKVTNNCLPLVVGIHTCDVGVALAQAKQARECGAHAILLKYVGNWSATAAETMGFVAAVAEADCLPVFYYHYPSQTGLKLSPWDVAQILLLPNVIGIKESILNLAEVEQHVALSAGAGKIFLSGTALNLTQFVQVGGHGAMCPESCLLPSKTAAAFEACAAADFATARCIQEELFVVVPVIRGGFTTPAMARCIMMTTQDHKLPMPMGGDSPQARMKAAMSSLCVPMAPIVKCPLPELSYSDQRAINRNACELKEAACRQDCGHGRSAPGYDPLGVSNLAPVSRVK